MFGLKFNSAVGPILENSEIVLALRFGMNPSILIAVTSIGAVALLIRLNSFRPLRKDMDTTGIESSALTDSSSASTLL